MYHLPRPGRAGRGPDGREGERDGHHISKTAPNDMRNSTAAATSTTYHGLKWHRVGQRTHCDFQICESTRLALCHQSASLCWWRDARLAKKSNLTQPFKFSVRSKSFCQGKQESSQSWLIQAVTPGFCLWFEVRKFNGCLQGLVQGMALLKSYLNDYIYKYIYYYYLALIVPYYFVSTL